METNNDCENEYPSEKVVISGMSGRFPKSNNMQEFSDNLYNKVDMTDDDESRWKHFHPDVPKRTGKILNLEKFDSSFFSIHNRLANATDPQARILLEHSYEAILDAGISPQSLIGSRTGVFIGCSSSDSKDLFLFKIPTKDGHAISGNANFYLANRISFALGLCGPSFTVDTACSSSGYALDLAYKYIQDGTCDSALVGGSQLVLNLSTTTEYKRLRVLANDGVSRPFDKEASGFTRSEAISVIFLQKQKDSKRIYAHLLHVNTNNDGNKLEGTSFPSRDLQRKLFEECYKKINLNPNLVSYIEAHSTGTIFGDSEEVASIDGAYCKNRTKPLTIGSLKSNMGHAEAASAIASIAKLIFTLEKQQIPPNINLKELRDDIPAFSEGRIRVIREIEKLDGSIVALNSFGLGGANSHAIFKGNEKSKINNGIPTDNLNRLVCWAGRTEAAINSIFDDILSRPLDGEHVALLQNSQIKTTLSNTYRGFGIFRHDESTKKAALVQRNIQHFNSVRKPIVWVYSGIGSQWSEMGKDLMQFPVFSKSIDFCHNVLLCKGLNLKKIITTADSNNLDNVLHSYVGIVAIEIALTDMMKSVGLKPDYIIGHSVGELGCAYCDGCFTAEETILVAYARGLSNNQSETILGGMAAVGKSHTELLDMLPVDIDIACHNAADSTTISGPADSIKAFVQKLTSANIFAKEISCSGVPLHSRYIKDMGVKLNKLLKEVITNPKKRSAKWLSSTYPPDQWSQDESKYSSVEYHTKNLLSPVYFHEVIEQIPECVTIEIAPHGLLKPILKRSMKECIHFNLTQRGEKNGALLLMKTLGEIFQNGIDIDVGKLYEPIEFPVSRGTPMISPMLKWDHSQDLFVPHFNPSDWYEKRNILINISDKEFEFVQGHVIDGKVLFPGTGLVFLVWETFAMLHGMPYQKLAVTLEEVKFLRATSLKLNQDVILSISIHKVSGTFEISEGQSIVAHGKIRVNDNDKMTDITAPDNSDSFKLLDPDFYKEMRLRGYYHKDMFRAVTESRDDGLEGKIQWKNNWTSFIDCLIQFQVLTEDTRMLILPTKFRMMVINPLIHEKILAQSSNDVVDVVTCPYTKIIRAGGVEIHEFEGSAVSRRRQIADPVLEVYKFIPHNLSAPLPNVDMAKFCVQLLIENTQTNRLLTVEVDSFDGKEPLSELIYQGVSDLPMITSDINYLSAKQIEMDNVRVEPKGLKDFEDVHIIVKSRCLNDYEFLKLAKKSIHQSGFIMSRESQDVNLPIEAPNGLQVIATIPTETELVVLLQFITEDYARPDKVVRITSNVNEWLEPLKEAVKSGSVLAFSQNEDNSGILGLFNCVRRELSAGSKLTCVFIEDSKAPAFELNLPFYKLQLQKGLAINVLKNDEWGSYRHVRLTEDNEIKPREDHFYVNCLTKGDLSTLYWFAGNIESKIIKNDPECYRIVYSALNFRDVMQATGKISFSHLNRLQQQSVLGHEFAGVKRDGTKFIGLGQSGGFSNFFRDEDSAVLDIPNDWSLEDAVTVPLAYCTVFVAFFFVGKIKQGQSVLIHAGSGGVGLAALHIAFHYGFDVYTTVSTEEKKNFLLKEFPLLKKENIGNSRNTSFERMVNVNTEGKGVDYVLNSLSEDKLVASLRCLADNGTFLEIGKFDIMNKTKIDLGFLAKKIVIKPIFLGVNDGYIEGVFDMVRDHMIKGIIKPLNKTIFDASDIQSAFRYLASGKHIGKVLIKIREHESDVQTLPIAVRKQIFCDKSHVYIIVGGMGGFGLELADWLILRGCKNIVLSSSRGITNGYQAVRIKTWQSYGVNVVINMSDVITECGCNELIQEAIKMGPVGGIFNLAVALRDGLFENQNIELFKESFGPKAIATKHLDKLSRKLCPQLKHFVIFSSVSCGRGNAGQSNYGMANSIMEKIIERRFEANLPAKAIQWGAVGDVGLLADLQEKNMDMQISGTLPQRITSCIEVLDSLLSANEAIVGSMVVAEKQIFEFTKENVIESLFNILGIRDKKNISMNSPLSKLGMDSLMTVEITQLLEREYFLFLTTKELQSMTLHELEQRTKSKDSKETDNYQNHTRGFELLLQNIINEPSSDDVIVCLKSGSDEKSNKILVIPGIEGMVGTVWKTIASTFKYDSYALQINKFPQAESFKDIHDCVIQDILKLYADSDSFYIIGHSFGTLLALEIAKSLEMRGRIGNVIMIDGSPLFFKKFAENMGPVDTPDEYIQHEVLETLIKIDFPDERQNILESALTGTSWEEKLESFLTFYHSNESLAQKYSKNLIIGLCNRLKMTKLIDEASFPFLKSTKISLVTPSEKLVSHVTDNYNLNRYSSQSVEALVVNGNHLSILQTTELSNFINSFN